MLDDLRRKRDEEKTLKKKKQQLQMAGKAGATTLGFAGAQVLGFSTNYMNRDPGFQTAPRLGGGQVGGHMAYNQSSYASEQL